MTDDERTIRINQVIMATNRIDILDSALLRPGRIDRKIEFPPPGPEARVSILRIHSRKMSLQRGINLRALAEQMGNCSGAEVRGICTEAGECFSIHPLLFFTRTTGVLLTFAHS
jgi:ATP-dependent 26S proteasome regulatory subunit